MKQLFVLVVASLLARPTFAAEDEAAFVARLLQAKGLLPGKPRADVHGEWGIAVRGTAGEPELVDTSCVPGYQGSWTFEGKRFAYDAKNKGEWGGELSVREGDSPARPLLRENVLFMVPQGTDLYVFSGLDHGMDDGGLHVIENYDSRPRLRSISRLPGTPLAVHDSGEFNAGILVVSRLSLTRVRTGSDSLEVLMARHAPLYGANSILAIGKSQILVGLCEGVAQVQLPWRMRPPDATYEIPIVTFWTRGQ